MKQEDIKTTVSKIEKRVTKIERQLDTVQPEKVALDSTVETSQEEHQAALTSYHTKRKGPMNLSLNGLPMSEAQTSALLGDKEEPGSKQDG